MKTKTLLALLALALAVPLAILGFSQNAQTRPHQAPTAKKAEGIVCGNIRCRAGQACLNLDGRPFQCYLPCETAAACAKNMSCSIIAPKGMDPTEFTSEQIKQLPRVCLPG